MLDRVAHDARVVLRRYDDDRGVGGGCAQSIQRTHELDARQIQVQQQQIVMCGLQSIERIFASILLIHA